MYRRNDVRKPSFVVLKNLEEWPNCGVASFQESGLEYRPGAAPKVYRWSGVEVY